MKKIEKIALLFGIIGLAWPVSAQENPDDILMVNNEIENNFYDAVKQRAIENYDKAIVSIDKCIDAEPNNAAFYYELGKNNLDLKKYTEAEQAFQKAVNLNPKERWYWNGLYDVYYVTKDYQKSITIVKKLIEFDENMQEDLVSLYMYTGQKEEALKLLDDMKKTMVLSQTMEFYKQRLTAETAQKDGSLESKLKAAILSNPKDQQAYVDLMMYYSQINQEDKAIEVAKQLAKEIPNSEWAQISLFKLYLNENNGDKAAESLLKVLKNPQADLKLKHKLLNEFLIFSANSTQYDVPLEQAVDLLAEDKTINVAKEVAKFYFNKKNYEKTTLFLEKALMNDPNDWESISLLLDNLANAKNFEALALKTEIFIDTFPAQPKLYYYAGLAKYNLGKYKEAIEDLKNGLEFVVDDMELEFYFNNLLGESYLALGNENQSKSYFSKAESLKKAKK